MYKNNKLVEQQIDQIYCQQCDRFLADRFIEGECPICHYEKAGGDQCDKCGNLLNATELIHPRCKVGGPDHIVEKKSTTHLFLDLPQLEQQLKQWVDTTSIVCTRSPVDRVRKVIGVIMLASLPRVGLIMV